MFPEMRFNQQNISLARPLLIAAAALASLVAVAALVAATVFDTAFGAALEKHIAAWPVAVPIAALAVPGALLLLLIRDLQNTARDLDGEFAERGRLETSQERLMTILEEMPATIVMTDADGRIQYVNRRFEELTGWTRNDALGETPSYLRYGETDDDAYKTIRDLIAAGDSWRGVLRTLRKDGSSYRTVTMILPLKSPDGIVRNLVGIGDDRIEDLADSERATGEDREGHAKDGSIP